MTIRGQETSKKSTKFTSVGAYVLMAFASSSTSRPLGGFQSKMDATAWNAGSSQRAPVAPKPATLDLPALQAASRVLQDQFVKDAQIIPDLGELLSIRKFYLFVCGARN